MKKSLRTIFGRLTVIGLAIVLQILVLIAFLAFLNTRFWMLQALNGILGVIVFFNIIQRDMYPDSKLPWLVVVMAMPLFGTVLYFMFAKNSMPRKQKRLTQALQRQREALSEPCGDVRLRDPYQGQSEYIRSTTSLPLYDRCACDYLPSGEAFWEALKEELAKAERFIFLEYFIIERGVMWNAILDILKEKAGNGVEVRVMYDDMGSVGKLPMRYHKTLQSYGIRCVKFNPFRPIVSGIHNNRDHRKIAVIDGKVGFIGGANLADEYINLTSPFGKWKDSAVRLKGKAVRSLTWMFLASYQRQTGVVEEIRPYFPEVCEAAEGAGYVQPYPDGPAPAYKTHIGENVYINLIHASQKYLYITTPYLIIDHELQTALRSAALRGVDVRIVTPHIPDKKLVFHITRSNYKPLMDCGVRIYEYTPGFVHAKNFLSDDTVGVVGTINLDYRSLTHHYECAVWMHDVPALQALKADFEQTFRECILQDENTVKMSLPKRLTCVAARIFTPLL